MKLALLLILLLPCLASGQEIAATQITRYMNCACNPLYLSDGNSSSFTCPTLLNGTAKSYSSEVNAIASIIAENPLGLILANRNYKLCKVNCPATLLGPLIIALQTDLLHAVTAYDCSATPSPTPTSTPTPTASATPTASPPLRPLTAAEETERVRRGQSSTVRKRGQS